MDNVPLVEGPVAVSCSAWAYVVLPQVEGFFEAGDGLMSLSLKEQVQAYWFIIIVWSLCNMCFWEVKFLIYCGLKLYLMRCVTSKQSSVQMLYVVKVCP